MQDLGIDWGTRKAARSAIGERGEMVGGTISADEDGSKLVCGLGTGVRGCVEI